jgi:ADP-ribose pyrophosphatase
MVRHIYQGRIVDLRLERVTLPNGAVTELEVMHHPGAACVAPANDAGEVLLIRQYRHAVGQEIWELPAGLLQGGEVPAECAARELAEETGLTAGRLLGLGAILPTPGYSDERIHLFLAQDLQAGEQAHEADEVIVEQRWVPWPEALAMVARGAIEDAKSIAGLHRAAAHLGRLA